MNKKIIFALVVLAAIVGLFLFLRSRQPAIATGDRSDMDGDVLPVKKKKKKKKSKTLLSKLSFGLF